MELHPKEEQVGMVTRLAQRVEALYDSNTGWRDWTHNHLFLCNGDTVEISPASSRRSQPIKFHQCSSWFYRVATMRLPKAGDGLYPSRRRGPGYRTVVLRPTVDTLV